MKTKKIVSTRGLASMPSAGIGYLTVPDDLDRDLFVKQCFKQGKVAIVLESGGVKTDVTVASHVFNYLDFPPDNKSLGSLVFWVNKPKDNKPVIIATINKNNEFINLSEHNFKLGKSFKNGNYVEISGDAKSGALMINAQGTDSGGNLNITVTNKNDNASLDILVRGKTSIKTIGSAFMSVTDTLECVIEDLTKDKKRTSIKYKKGEGLTYEDEFENVIKANKQNVQINAKKIVNLGKGKEPISMGDQTQKMFDEFITLVSQATVTTSLGVMPLLNASQIAQLRTKTKKILSKYSFTD